MSTSLDIYPFSKASKLLLCSAISEYFNKLTGLEGVNIDVAVHNEAGDGQMRWLKADESLVPAKRSWYSVWENNHVKAGAMVSTIEVGLVVENSIKYPSPLVSISDIRLKPNSMLILQLCAALGLAKASNNDCIFHSGDFGWVAGLHKTSPHTSRNEELQREGYVSEFDIPLSLIDEIRNSDRTECIDQAVLKYFSDKQVV
jgi:hypothetical protein